MGAENILGRDERPTFFAVDDAPALGFEPPTPRKDLALRTYVRSLAGMQKEAIVVSSASDRAWRLVSDEGPYLDGHDEAPFPLAFLNAGMVASYMNEVVALAEQRDVQLDDIRLTLDNYYMMEGSAVRGTMKGGALPPELHVEAASTAERSQLLSLAADAVDASPLNGLLRGENTSLFTLTHNGADVELGRVARLEGPALKDLAERFDDLPVDGPDRAEELMVMGDPAEPHEGEGGAGSSLQAEQKRTLHVRGACTVRDDGLKQIEISLFKPSGSSFRMLSDEPSERGGGGRAPDAATLISAGVAFCFMTQFGRYISIQRREVDEYRVTQDTHFSWGGASAGTGRPGEADPVETHAYVDTSEDADFVREMLDMGEQTCFLHALCRTDLKTRLRLTRD